MSRETAPADTTRVDPLPGGARPPMLFERDLPVEVRDGTVLRANVYRPATDIDVVPVIMSFGPYGKDRPLAERSPEHFDALGRGVFLNWETADPERWVPRGYAVVRVDSRGSGSSPGHLDPLSPGTVEDYYDAIEWAGQQPWSNGRVGLLGISYYASSQWAVAALRPPHLTAMIPFEGAADLYRELRRHGGILSSDFLSGWWRSVCATQHGVGASCETELERTRTDPVAVARTHPLDDEVSRRWLPDISRIDVPFLSVGNWANLGLHLRGNIEAFVAAGSPHKWLRVITGDHIVPFYSTWAISTQEKFFGYWLQGRDTGWMQEPVVALAVRDPEGEWTRSGSSWPLPDTAWSELHLDGQAGTLGSVAPNDEAAVSFPALEGELRFTTEARGDPLEICGPVELRLTVSSSTTDADIFARLRVLAPDGTEHWAVGPDGGANALAQGWLRASHRALDPRRSMPGRPFHPHQNLEPLTPGSPVELSVEIWPTSIVVPRRHRLILEIRGSDGPGTHFAHRDPVDRPTDIFAATTTIHTGPGHAASLLLPTVPGADPPGAQ